MHLFKNKKLHLKILTYAVSIVWWPTYEYCLDQTMAQDDNHEGNNWYSIVC